ncbi:MAG: DoxX family protein [Verrucomicrobiae bacterium]|nr:DoxX family protein [Verrucomicrobiae bacterium]NNJ42216.1 DoxX family protein [Akkermansiaceae bacterium]
MIIFVLRIVASLVLLQSLFFKLTAAEESVAMFASLSAAVTGDASLEPAMRMGVSVVELVTVILLMMKRPAAIATGAMLAVGTMFGAIFAHLAVLGIEVGGGVTHFVLAVVVLLLSLVILFRYRGSLPILGRFT